MIDDTGIERLSVFLVTRDWGQARTSENFVINPSTMDGCISISVCNATTTTVTEYAGIRTSSAARHFINSFAVLDVQ